MSGVRSPFFNPQLVSGDTLLGMSEYVDRTVERHLERLAAVRAQRKGDLDQATINLREAAVEAVTAGLSVAVVAKRCDVPRMTVHRWNKGEE